MGEIIYSDQSRIGELIASLLDYARLLGQDSTVEDMVTKRVTEIRLRLDAEGLTWEDAKRHIVNQFALFPVEIHF